MGLDMRFLSSKDRINATKFNTDLNNSIGNYSLTQDIWDNMESKTTEIYYFRKFYELHDLIKDLYAEEDPEGFKKFGDNCTLIELTLPMLETIEEWYYAMPDHEFDWDKDFYNVLCGMIYRTKHGEFFYYEGDY